MVHKQTAETGKEEEEEPPQAHRRPLHLHTALSSRQGRKQSQAAGRFCCRCHISVTCHTAELERADLYFDSASK